VRRAAGRRARPVAWALPVAGALALSGCAAVPQQVEAGEPTRPGITQEDLTAALADYDERNNAAIDLSSREHDPSGWATADRGVVLRVDHHHTRYAAASKAEKTAGTPVTTTADALVSPSFARYPMWFTVAGRVDAEGEDGPVRVLLVYERDGVLDPWRLSASITLPAQKRLTPRAPGDASTPTGAQVEAAQALTEQIATYLETGEDGGVTMPKRVVALREQMVGDPGTTKLAEVTVEAVGSGDDPADPGEGTPKVAVVEEGALVTATFVVSYTQKSARGDVTLAFNDQAFAEAVGQPGQRSSFDLASVLEVAAVLPDEGAPTFLGASVSPVAAVRG